jgi:hypothetical protein
MFQSDEYDARHINVTSTRRQALKERVRVAHHGSHFFHHDC